MEEEEEVEIGEEKGVAPRSQCFVRSPFCPVSAWRKGQAAVDRAVEEEEENQE